MFHFTQKKSAVLLGSFLTLSQVQAQFQNQIQSPSEMEAQEKEVYENRPEVILEGEASPKISWKGATQLPHSMGALGDSITSGSLANYHRSRAVWVAPFFILQEFLTFIVGNGRPTERRDYSWSTGLNPFKPVMSHAHRLKKLIPRGRMLRVYNAALSGAVSDDIVKTQLPELMDWSHKHLKQAAPDYITVLIGANNICANSAEEMTPTSDYQRDIASVVDTVLQQSPNSHIYLSSLPRIDSLRDVTKDAPLFRVKPVEKCEDLWTLAKVCPTLTTISDPAQREQVAQRVRDYNYALRDLAETRARDFGDRVRFSEGAYGNNFTADDVSVDCFHPNPEGQNKIAESTWHGNWWAK